MSRTSPWDRCRDLEVVRGNHLYDPATLEPGVKFFVLMLERLGCTTSWSCEGHPKGFYLVFQGSEAIARAIDACGYFTVTVNTQGYELDLEFQERQYGDAMTMKHRDLLLREASRAWVKMFGQLRHPPRELPTLPPPMSDLNTVLDMLRRSNVEHLTFTTATGEISVQFDETHYSTEFLFSRGGRLLSAGYASDPDVDDDLDFDDAESFRRHLIEG